jgi:WD40 repeat protein
MLKRNFPRYLPFVIALVLLGGANRLESRNQAPQVSTLRGELIRLQKESGLSLVSIQDNKIRAVSFADRKLKQVREVVKQVSGLDGTISPDGAELAFSFCSEPELQHPSPYVTMCGGRDSVAIAAADGTGFREFPNLRYGLQPCWSYDDAKLASSWQDRSQTPGWGEGLKILDLKSGHVEPVDELDSFATNQCWSPDGKQFVYTLNKAGGIQTVRLYDTTEKKSHDLADGGNATWSPDGKWIAYLHCPPELYNCEYDEIRPDGSGRQRIFAVTIAEGGLFWSPDSKMAAYIGENTSSVDPPGAEQGPNELRVRLLDSQAEDWVVHFSESDSPFFQWAKISEMEH